MKGWSWRCRFPSCVGSIVQFQCRLFLRNRALIFGDPAGFWVRCFGLKVVCLAVLVGFFHVAWVLITAGSGLLVGRGVVMVLRLGLWRLLVLASWMTYFLSLAILLGPVSLLLMVLSGCGIVLPTFLIKKTYLWVAAFWWRGCSGFCCCCSSAGSWFAGFW